MGEADTFDDVKNPILRYALRQGVTQFILLMILATMSYISYWGVTQGIPMHLQQIQQGYERIETKYAEELHQIEEQRKDNLSRVIDAFEKALDRADRNRTSLSGP